MFQFLRYIFKVFRTSEWVITKYLFNLSLMFAFAIYTGLPPSDLLKPALLFLMYMLPVGAFAHLFNDISDVKYDNLAGKINRSQYVAVWKKYLIIILLLLAACFPAFFIDGRCKMYFFLLFLQLLLIVLYSSRVTRFKSNYAGLFCDAFYSYVIPGAISLLFASTKVQGIVSSIFWPFIFWLYFLGFRSIFHHQLKDYEKDVASGQRTFVVRVGKERAFKLLGIGVVLELMFFILMVAFMQWYMQLGLLAGVVLFVLFECIISKNACVAKLFTQRDLGLLNAFYDYYLLLGFAVSYVIIGKEAFLLLLLLFSIYRFPGWYKVGWEIVTKWIYYKYRGLLRRIKKIM